MGSEQRPPALPSCSIAGQSTAAPRRPVPPLLARAIGVRRAEEYCQWHHQPWILFATEIVHLVLPLLVLVIYVQGTGWRLDVTIAAAVGAVANTIHQVSMSVFGNLTSMNSAIQRYLGMLSAAVSITAICYLSVRSALAPPAQMPWGNPFMYALVITLLVRPSHPACDADAPARLTTSPDCVSGCMSLNSMFPCLPVQMQGAIHNFVEHLIRGCMQMFPDKLCRADLHLHVDHRTESCRAKRQLVCASAANRYRSNWISPEIHGCVH